MVIHIFTCVSLAGSFVFISVEFRCLIFILCVGVPRYCGIVHVTAVYGRALDSNSHI
jgi:hypothetical protein